MQQLFSLGSDKNRGTAKQVEEVKPISLKILMQKLIGCIFFLVSQTGKYTVKLQVDIYGSLGCFLLLLNIRKSLNVSFMLLLLTKTVSFLS